MKPPADTHRNTRVALLIVALAIVAMLALTGCYKPAESTERRGNGFEVERLFVHDDCTVYRFSDGGQPRYFVRCPGSRSTSIQWRERTGEAWRDVLVLTMEDEHEAL